MDHPIDKQMKTTTTIFRQLILNVISPVLLSLLALTVINYTQTRKNLTDYNVSKNQIITNEIKHILELQDFSFELIEKSLETRMFELSQKIITNYVEPNKNIEDLNLFKIRQELGMDPEKEDIYLVSRDGIIKKSTFLQDINLNLFDFGEEHKKYIESIFEGGEFVSERFANEDRTKRLKKYTYQPTPDKQYIIEIGSYSDEADEIVSNVREIFESLAAVEEGILSIDLFLNPDNPFPLNKLAELPETHTSSVVELFETKGIKSIQETIEDKPILYEYIYIERKNTGLYKDAIIQIVSDRTAQLNFLNKELFKSLIIFLLTMVVVIILIYRRARVITDPIKKLVENVKRISDGNFKERAEVVGKNEIAELTNHFNDMITKIEDSYKMLEEKVETRTQEITLKNEQLAQKNKLLSEINQNQKIINQKLKDSETNLKEVISTKDKFFSIISHDLKNPLNSLISLSELLIKGIRDNISVDEILELSKYIHESSKHLFNLLENLLQWASSHTGKLKYVPEIFDLKEIVEETVLLLKLNAENKELHIKSEVKENTLVYADKDMITTIFRNLISNAIKFSNTGDEIVITSGYKKNYVETSVIDNGIGISEENLKKLFRRDELFTTPGTNEEKGTGLGLILSKEFIEKNGGSIWVNSEVNKGTKFTFQIPREKSVSSLLTHEFTENPM